MGVSDGVSLRLRDENHGLLASSSPSALVKRSSNRGSLRRTESYPPSSRSLSPNRVTSKKRQTLRQRSRSFDSDLIIDGEDAGVTAGSANLLNLMANLPVNLTPHIEAENLPPAQPADLAHEEDDEIPELFRNHMDPNTRLVDIRLEELSVLYCLGGCFPVNEFKDKVLFGVRSLFIQVMQRIANDHNELRNWTKFFMLPYIFFTTAAKEVHLRYLEILKTEEGWDSLTVQSLLDSHKPDFARLSAAPQNLAEPQGFLSTENQPSKLHRSVYTKVQAGRLSKAMQKLTAGGVELEDDSFDNIVELLKSKHPKVAQNRQGEVHHIFHELQSVHVQDEDLLKVNEEDIREIVNDLEDLKLPGVDLFLSEHLKLFMGTRFTRRATQHLDADEKRFTVGYTHIVNLLLCGRIPKEVATYLRSNLLMALPKTATDIRPIGIGGMLRKIACKALFRSNEMKVFNRDHFSCFQYALKPGGMEYTVHACTLVRASHPEWDIYCMDADNAFNSAFKYYGIRHISESFKMAFPLLRWVYCYMGMQFFFRDGHMEQIPSVIGFHQGDVLGTWCYIMTIQPLLESLADHLQETFPHYPMEVIRMMIFFYVDDGNLCGPHELLVEAIRYIRDKGRKYGYIIKPNKGGYLIGKCDTAQEAIERYNTLTSPEEGIELGTNIVHIHPDNLEEAEADGVELPLKYSEGELTDPLKRQQAYGVKILGSFIGSDLYVKARVEEVLHEWNKTARCLIELPFYQQRMLLFRQCFNMKPIHLLRTLPLRFTTVLAERFRELQKEILASMFHQELEDGLMDLLCLPIAEGGLGMLNFYDVQRVAHCASFFGFKDLRTAYVSYLENNPQALHARDPFMRSLHDELVLLKEYMDLPEDATDEDVINALDRLAEETRRQKYDTFQHTLYRLKNARRKEDLEEFLRDNRQKTYQHACMKNETAGKWLEVIPRFKNMEINNSAYTIGLCFRYLLPQPLIDERQRCPLCSKQSSRIDKTGHHFVSGCARDVEGINGAVMKAQRHANHNHLRQALYLCCKHAMTHAQEEPGHLFPGIEKALRPDLVVSFPVKLEMKTFALDVTLVCPFDGSQKGDLKVPTSDQQEVEQCDKQANQKAKAKRDKYGQVCKDRNIEFVPFVFYTTGKLHQEAVKFLRLLATHAAEHRKLSEGTLFRYYLKMLSISLVQRIGYTIQTKAVACTTRNFRIREVLRNGNEQALMVGGSQHSRRRG